MLIGILASIIFASALNIAASTWYNGMMWNHNSMTHGDNSDMSHHEMMHDHSNSTMQDECEDMMNEHSNSTHTNI